MLPGGSLLLPIVLKIIPDLIPSAFQENKIDKEDEQMFEETILAHIYREIRLSALQRINIGTCPGGRVLRLDSRWWGRGVA